MELNIDESFIPIVKKDKKTLQKERKEQQIKKIQERRERYVSKRSVTQAEEQFKTLKFHRNDARDIDDSSSGPSNNYYNQHPSQPKPQQTQQDQQKEPRQETKQEQNELEDSSSSSSEENENSPVRVPQEKAPSRKQEAAPKREYARREERHIPEEVLPAPKRKSDLDYDDTSEEDQEEDNFDQIVQEHDQAMQLQQTDQSFNQFSRENRRDQERKPRREYDENENQDQEPYVPREKIYFEQFQDQIKQEEITQEDKDKLFSSQTFKDLNLHKNLQRALDELKLDKMTLIQQRSFDCIYKYHNCIVQAETGSGKTYCYLVPMIQQLLERQKQVTRDDNCLILVICPTRELALQILQVSQALNKRSAWIVTGEIVGGDNIQHQKSRLRKGLNIVVCTPGRLLYHLRKSSGLKLENLQGIVLEECDRILDYGFKRELTQVLELISQKCNFSWIQKVMISASINSNVKTLLESLGNYNYTYISKDAKKEIGLTMVKDIYEEEDQQKAREENAFEVEKRNQENQDWIDGEEFIQNDQKFKAQGVQDKIERIERQQPMMGLRIKGEEAYNVRDHTLTEDELTQAGISARAKIVQNQLRDIDDKPKVEDEKKEDEEEELDFQLDEKKLRDDLKQKLREEAEMAQLKKLKDQRKKNSQKMTINEFTLEDAKIPDSLTQNYAIVTERQKITFLFAMLKQTEKTKKIIFVATADQANFLYFLISNYGYNKVEIIDRMRQQEDNKQGMKNQHINTEEHHLYKLHGFIDQKKRSEVFNQFNKCELGTLISTDLGCRGLDFKNVNLIFVFDPPQDIADYINRIGRSARIMQKGSSLLFLSPSEQQFVDKIKENYKINEVDTGSTYDAFFKQIKEADRQNQSTGHFYIDYVMKEAISTKESRYLARRAYNSFCRAYARIRDKSIFRVKNLNLFHLAKAYGLEKAFSKGNETKDDGYGEIAAKGELKMARYRNIMKRAPKAKAILLNEFM